MVGVRMSDETHAAVNTLVKEVEGKFISAFVRASKPVTGCCSPGCCSYILFFL